MKNYDVIIIGAGPSGAVSAAYLNKKGYQVLVLEKSEFPRFVIGESLLPHCMDHLDEAGLLEAVKAVGFQKKTGATFYKGDTKCEFLFDEQYTESWKWTWQVKRADFDKVLIDEVIKQGVEVLFNAEVTNVECTKDIQTVDYITSNKEQVKVTSKFIIDASGYGRVLPKMFDLNIPSTLPARGSIFTRVVDVNRTQKAGENIFVHSFNNNQSWLWAIPFADGTTSVGVVGKDDFIKEYSENDGEKFKAFIQNFEGLNNRFKDVDLVFDPKTIYGYSIGVKKMYGDGFVLCGNSTEFLDPIFSSGVTLATYTGLKAAKLLDKQLLGENVNWEKDYQEIILEGVEVFRTYIEAWYNGDFQKIIFSETIDPMFKKQICSILAGYVWDKTNPFIKRHKTILPTLVKVIEMKESV